MHFEPYPFEKLNTLLKEVTPNPNYEPSVLTIGEPQFETPDFIKDDPIFFPHKYNDKKDIEISAFLTSWIAFGNRKLIMQQAEILDNLMGNSPYAFIMNKVWEQYKENTNTFYRMFTYHDFFCIGEHRITNVYLYLNWENVSKKMKVRTQQNFNRKTYETVFGISIMPDGGRRYCKYPIGHQEYKDYTQAHQAMKDVQKILDNGGRLVYSPKGSAGINKNEYVKIEMT